VVGIATLKYSGNTNLIDATKEYKALILSASHLGYLNVLE
jgi:hypothetical protein